MGAMKQKETWLQASKDIYSVRQLNGQIVKIPFDLLASNMRL